jgi:ferritin-like metal-binding protein YciE
MAKTREQTRKTPRKAESTKGKSSEGGMTDTVMKMGKQAAKGIASMLPDALGGRLLNDISMEYESLKDLYIKELQDLLSAERQLIEALPKMAEAASSASLRNAFQAHLKETETHADRLEQIFKAHGMPPKSTKCKAMEGLVKEGSEWMKENAKEGVMDAGLIAAAQRVEHYEMAGYGCTRTYAKLLGDKLATKLLQQTLDEEGAADKKLTEISKQINVQATGQPALTAMHSTPKSVAVRKAPTNGRAPKRKKATAKA